LVDRDVETDFLIGPECPHYRIAPHPRG
jgi:hypothetical protein